MSYTIFVVILVLIAVEIGLKSRQKQTAARRPGVTWRQAPQTPEAPQSPKARPAEGGVQSVKAAEEAAPPRERTFVTMEGRAEETRWHEAVMGEEGTDSCHDEMYADIHAEEPAANHADAELAREWAKAVVMAEILKRPSERRWSARGGK